MNMASKIDDARSILIQLRKISTLDDLRAAANDARHAVLAGHISCGDASADLYGMAEAAGLVAEYNDEIITSLIAEGFAQAELELDSENDELDSVAEAKTPTVPPRCALVSRCAADIEPEKIEWLWAGRIARGKHTCVAGEPGAGKSQLTIAVTAAVTTNGEWPCGEGRAPCGNVIFLSAEDGAADTIVPRLMAAGADRSRVHVVSAVDNPDGSRRGLNLQQDIALLEKKIAEVGDVVLVVIDPVSSYLGKADSHKNSEVRGVLEPLSELAERTRVAILTVTHFSKAGATNTTKALHRFIGSIAFVGAPRVAFAVIEDAEHNGRYLVLHAKNNLAPAPQGLRLPAGAMPHR